MKVIRDSKKFVNLFSKGSIITLGNFDGIHYGHVALINRIIEISKQKNIPSVLVTYYPHPAIVIRKIENFKYIYPNHFQEFILSKFELDFIYKMNFSEKLSSMDALDYLEKIIIQQLNAKYIVIGYNHSFGKNKIGNFDFLKQYSSKYNYEVEQIEPVYINKEKVSSSLIRNYLSNGNLEKVNSLMCKNFFLRGIVIKGFQRGKTIGYPTANIQIDENIIIPKQGVYACLVNIENQIYKAMVNIGNNPTFNNQKLSVEGFIFDFNKDIYGKEIEYQFIHRVRDEKKFSSIDELINQLKNDEAVIREFLK